MSRKRLVLSGSRPMMQTAITTCSLYRPGGFLRTSNNFILQCTLLHFNSIKCLANASHGFFSQAGGEPGVFLSFGNQLLNPATNYLCVCVCWGEGYHLHIPFPHPHLTPITLNKQKISSLMPLYSHCPLPITPNQTGC